MVRGTTTALDAGATDGEVVHRENKLRLVRYRPTAGRARRTPLVLVYAVVNRPYVLDLLPGRSVVRAFLDRGFDVYLVDWGDPSALDADLGLADYVGRYLANCLDRVRDLSEADRVHLFGYCTGATLAAIYAALHQGSVRTLVLLAPLLNFDAEGGIFRFWGREEGYDREALVGAFGNAPGEWLAVEFSTTAPVEFSLGRSLRLCGTDDPLDRAAFARRHRWGADTVDVPGRLFREFLADLYGANALLEGTLVLDGRRVDPGAIDVPVLLIRGEDDEFVPPEAGEPFLDAVSSDDVGVFAFPTDHVGLSVSAAAHADLWPRVCDWLERRT